jgi:hypothetical protein
MAEESVISQGKGILSIANKSLASADEVSPLTKSATTPTANDVSSNFEQASSEAAGSQKSRTKQKLFSRRKDVIIKTLLRKCRKFYLKDFNAKTSYLKTVKRKFGSSAYKSLLEDYINMVFKVPCTEKLLLFMGVFLYKQDLEENLDLFVSPNYTPNDGYAFELITSVHDILYKYSHQKFYNFSKNEEFKLVFNHFSSVGAQELVQDREYELGLDIIKGQL